jgi:hypothetical protein
MYVHYSEGDKLTCRWCVALVVDQLVGMLCGSRALVRFVALSYYVNRSSERTAVDQMHNINRRRTQYANTLAHVKPHYTLTQVDEDLLSPSAVREGDHHETRVGLMHEPHG